MSREEELEREWRQGVTRKLVNIEKTLKGVELSVATMAAKDFDSRLEKVEAGVGKLNVFKTKVVVTVAVVQVIFGIIIGVLKFM